MKRLGSSGPLLLVFFLVLLMMTTRADADIVNGYMQLDYNVFDSSSKSAEGAAMHTKSRGFNQQYNMNLNLDPFPNVKVNSGITVVKDQSSIRSEETIDMKTSNTSVRPFIDISLQDAFRTYSAGFGYNSRENISRSSGAPPEITENETYHAMVNWRPVDLPSVDVRAIRTNQYDKDRISQDITTDSLLFSTQYQLWKEVSVAYDAGFTGSRDRINEFETKTINQSGRLKYSDTFLDQRTAVSSSYTVAVRNTETTAQGAASVSFQLFPIAVLSVIDSDPVTAILTSGATLPANTLNIGSSPSLSGDTEWRQIGLDFFAETEVNNLLLSIDRQLTPEIANSFSWDIYTSANNLNWTFVQTVVAAPFGPFVNRFSIDFRTVKTRYLKVVTRPLSPAVAGAINPNFQNIFVTEIQATLTQPASAVHGERTQTSHIYNLNIRTRLMDPLNLYHDFAFSLFAADSTGAPSTQRHTVSNGFSLAHRFNPVFSGTARLGWEDSNDQNGARSDTYSYNAVLTAVPLPTLRSSLVYGGQILDQNGNKSNSNTVSLNATAELYPGVNVNTSGALTYSEADAGTRSRGASFLAGAGFVPHRALTLNANCSSNRTESVAADSRSTSSSDRWEGGAAFRPFETWYLSASVSRQLQSGKTPVTLQNYGLNWAPFPDGALEFHVTYSQSLRSDTDNREKVIGPGLTWRIIPRASLDLSYLSVTNESTIESSEIRSFFAGFRMSL